MKTIKISASGTYDVRIGAGILKETGAWTAELVKGRKAVIVSDSNVFPLYGETVEESLKRAGFAVERFVFPAGEASKNPETLLSIIHFLADHEVTRSDAVIALGGGVTGDMAGLSAALFLRGIPCIQIPTSLLAMVDSSVGGKTAVDLPQGKNLLGCFSQPRLVICDYETLNTLKPEVLSEGYAEVIKYGMIRSEELLKVLSSDDADDEIEWIIAHCVELKRDVVMADELDLGERQILNFGHTIGHAVERCAGYGMYHGEGVAIGMSIMTRAMVKLQRCPAECQTILEKLLTKYDLPQNTEFAVEQLLEASRADKKRRGDAITLIVPDSVGNCILHKTDYEELKRVLELGIFPKSSCYLQM